MISVAKRSMVVMVIVFLLGLGSGIGWTNGPGIISELRLGPDFKRLIIKSEGQVALQQAFTINRPPRLVIDFKDARFVRIPKTVKYRNKPIREMRTGKHGTGARVVLEFGDYAVPEYRIRKIEGYFIVFFGALSPAAPGNLLAAQADKTVHGRRSRTRGRNTDTGSDASRLCIKTAEVTDGRIVLRVARANEPARHYKVELDLDLKQRGFNMAHISPLEPNAHKSTMVAAETRSPRRAKLKRRQSSGSKKRKHAKAAVRKVLAGKGLFDPSDLSPEGKGLFHVADIRCEANGPRKTGKWSPVTKCSFSPSKDWPPR